MPLSDEARQRLMARSTRGRSAADIVEQATAVPDPSPFDSVTYTGNLQLDCQAELDALHAALVAADKAEIPNWSDVTNSRHYAVLVFVSRDDKDDFLLALGAYADGDKYLSGEVFQRCAEKVRADGPHKIDKKARHDPREEWAKLGLTPEQLAFREAAQKVKETVEIIGDSEYWVAICFRTEPQLAAFPRRIPAAVGGLAALPGRVRRGAGPGHRHPGPVQHLTRTRAGRSDIARQSRRASRRSARGGTPMQRRGGNRRPAQVVGRVNVGRGGRAAAAARGRGGRRAGGRAAARSVDT